MEVELNSAEAGPLLKPTDAFNTTQTTFVVNGILHALEKLEESISQRLKVLSNYSEQSLSDNLAQNSSSILVLQGFQLLERYSSSLFVTV